MKPTFTNFPKLFQAYEAELMEATQRVIQSGWYILGKEVMAFEQAYAHFCGTKHCIGVANGFDALQLILMAYKVLGILKEGDEIIVPANTVMATALAVTRNGFKLKLIDPNSDTFTIDAEQVKAALSPNTKALIFVHLYGKVADFEAIRSLLKARNILIIEDAAQAHGAIYHEKKAGNLGDAAAFSFYPTKNLGALGDAGAVTTNHDELAHIIRNLRNYGGINYQIDYQGINSRLSELQAAMLQVRLKYLSAENQRRREIATYYLNHIHNSYIKLPQVSDKNDVVWHQFVIKTTHRDELQAYLKSQSIPTLIHYPIPIHKQKAYQDLNQLKLPIAEQLSQQVLSLPISPHLSDKEVAYISQQINSFEPKLR